METKMHARCSTRFKLPLYVLYKPKYINLLGVEVKFLFYFPRLCVVTVFKIKLDSFRTITKWYCRQNLNYQVLGILSNRIIITSSKQFQSNRFSSKMYVNDLCAVMENSLGN